MQWLQSKGVRFVLSYGRQAFKDGDKFRFWGGLLVEAVGAGKGLSDQQFDVAEAAGIDIRYATQGVSLVQDDSGRVAGLRVLGPDGFEDIPGRTVVLGRGRLRGQRRDALPLPRPGLGAGQGAGHPL